MRSYAGRGTTQGSAMALSTKTKVTVLPTSHPRMTKVCRSFSMALFLEKVRGRRCGGLAKNHMLWQTLTVFMPEVASSRVV